ncbi:(R)-mandelonitrile lyase [Paracoccus spongiarum]|uniref:Cupin domain-containing protein n=1 Tax=Paracoccus spongiarum TaxID=3064387 RepID=A0ABT9JHB6_9RHOB|nr:cupin domain-containing protein [Paracoccus sp. 2205BS29-5]MDP5309015.1 cupin domain-containing protein [Paracoccus sp. 2205BS29-5]
MQITRNADRGDEAGPSAWFSGAVQIAPVIAAPAPARVAAAVVSFRPGARTAWHTHPLGQTLLILTGQGLAQREGGPVELLHPGDVVWFDPGERHWHGATAQSAMSHLAIQERLDGRAVDWHEHVADPLP